MLLTNDQRFLLDILREVRYMRLDQILPLMRLRDPAKAKSHCEAILRYLRYAGGRVGKSTHSRSCRWSRDGNSLSASFWRSSLRM